MKRLLRVILPTMLAMSLTLMPTVTAHADVLSPPSLSLFDKNHRFEIKDCDRTYTYVGEEPQPGYDDPNIYSEELTTYANAVYGEFHRLERCDYVPLLFEKDDELHITALYCDEDGLWWGRGEFRDTPYSIDYYWVPLSKMNLSEQNDNLRIDTSKKGRSASGFLGSIIRRLTSGLF